MTRPALLSHRILEGKVSLYRRPDSSTWQCSFRIGNRLLRQTTKCDDLTEAKEIAAELYITARIRFKEGLPTVSKSFKSVAEYAKATMNKAVENGTKKSLYEGYIRQIDHYFIPFFGNTAITNVDSKKLTEFAEYREKSLGRKPSKAFINAQNCALKRVFDAAVDRKYLSRGQVPDLQNDGLKAVKRPDFTNEEFVNLQSVMTRWITEGKKGLITTRREILRDYVLFVAYTGCRPGTETEGVKWQHIRYQTVNNVPYIFITVKGKTGTREIVARHSVMRPLARLLHRQTAYKDMPLADAIEQKIDAYVFAQPDGKEVTSMVNNFRQFLKEENLLIDPRNSEERSLYSLRHFYITRALTNGTPAAKLAKQCGTSITMIDRFYSHVTAHTSARELASGVIAD